MKVKKELNDILVSYGLTEDEITDLVERIDVSVRQFSDAKKQAERQLEHNEVVKAGLEATVLDATAREQRVKSLLTKITEVQVVEEEPVIEPTPK